MIAEDRYLARFRADPKRIAIRLMRGQFLGTYFWRATIVELSSDRTAWASGRTAVRALVRAYALAEEQGFEGIDRWMGRAYDHPQGRLAPPQRVTFISAEQVRRDRDAVARWQAEQRIG